MSALWHLIHKNENIIWTVADMNIVNFLPPLHMNFSTNKLNTPLDPTRLRCQATNEGLEICDTLRRGQGAGEERGGGNALGASRVDSQPVGHQQTTEEEEGRRRAASKNTKSGGSIETSWYIIDSAERQGSSSPRSHVDHWEFELRWWILRFFRRLWNQAVVNSGGISQYLPPSSCNHSDVFSPMPNETWKVFVQGENNA